MTIGKKISLACAALVALTIILGTVATLNISHLNSDVLSIVEGPLPGLESIAALQGYAKEQKVAMLEHIAFGFSGANEPDGVHARGPGD